MERDDDAFERVIAGLREKKLRASMVRGMFSLAKVLPDGKPLDEVVEKYHNMQLRQDVADRAYSLTRNWMWFVIAATFLSGAEWGFAKGFELSDGVLMTLIGASGAFGALAIVARGVFSARREKQAEDGEKSK